MNPIVDGYQCNNKCRVARNQIPVTQLKSAMDGWFNSNNFWVLIIRIINIKC